MNEEFVKKLLDKLDIDGLMFLTSCYNAAKLEASAVKAAYKVQTFLEEVHNHELVKKAKDEAQ